VIHDDVYNVDHAYYSITNLKVEFTIHTEQRSIVSHITSYSPSLAFIFCSVLYFS